MAPGFDLHGNNTYNMAETMNKMLMSARESNTLLDAMLHTIQLLHRHRMFLYEQMMEKKKLLLGACSVDPEMSHVKFPEGSVFPHVHKEHDVQLQLGKRLVDATPSARGDKNEVMCRSYYVLRLKTI